MPTRSPSPEFSPLAIGEDLTPLPTYKPASTTAIDFSGLLSPPLKLHEDLASGCGGQLWPAGMVLSKYMLREHRDLKNEKILELGAGGGLVGLAVAIGCHVESPLVITDQENMFPLMQQNIALNGLEKRVRSEVLDWGSPLTLQDVPSVVLAADCVYFEPAFPLLLKTLTELLEQNHDCVIYFCFKKRRRADMQFMKAAKKTFRVEEIDDLDKAVWSREGLFLYTFRWKG